MTVKMRFDGTDAEERYDFTLLVAAFQQRGGTLGKENQTLSKADRRSDAAIKRALDRISEPRAADDMGKAFPEPKAGEPDLRPRQLLAQADLALVLEQPDFERLVKYFDADTMVWMTGVVDRAEEVSQRLGAAMATAGKDED